MQQENHTDKLPKATTKRKMVLVAGPTASGKSKEAIRLAKELGGEVISVDSRQVYRGLDIGTEKITREEMAGIPHHLIDIREVNEPYSAGDFLIDAKQLVGEIQARGNVPVFAGGTHFYFDALVSGLPQIPMDDELREKLEQLSTEELAQQVKEKDPARFARLDPLNRRRLIRALEIIATHGHVPERTSDSAAFLNDHDYGIEWHIINPPKEELLPRITMRLQEALDRGLIDEVRRVRNEVGDTRLNELGLEYKIIGEYLRDECTEDSLLPALTSRLWHYARRQKAWLRKIADERVITLST
jgi:tRNA dimethylallyltransferase